VLPLARPRLLGLSGYQWLVVGAAWAGWGFDVFDALLFNFVAPSCIPALLHLPAGSSEAQASTTYWTGLLTSILLIGWALGGVLFGWVADRIGRRPALFATIALYAVGTAACALATSIGQLIAFRALASLGIGGEWGVGAALVAEAVPEGRRVEAGVALQTASPLGVLLASTINYQIAGVWLAGHPESAWRAVFLAGLAPVVLALAVRFFIRESDQWAGRPPARSSPSELWSRQLRALTLSGTFVSVIAVVTWWAANAFIPLLGASLAREHALAAHLPPASAALLTESWKSEASNAFNLGGLLGALAAVPLARMLGRRSMFAVYFVSSSIALFLTFGLDLAPAMRFALLLWVGAGVYGVFGVLPFYLPELFPAHLRATGAGFCYNIGRLLAAAGPLLIGLLAASTGGTSSGLLHTLFWAGVVPLAAAAAAPWLIVETQGRSLAVAAHSAARGDT
jgi:MFS family permease